jgi:NADH dehydrogenase FAD-containing subunit
VLCKPHDRCLSNSTPHGIFFEYSTLFSNFQNVQFVQGCVTKLECRPGSSSTCRHALVSRQGEQRGYIGIPFDFSVVSVGCAYGSYNHNSDSNPSFFCKPSVGLELSSPSDGSSSEVSSLPERLQQLAGERERLNMLNRSRGNVCVVGAGLVGVELAAEIAHYFPRKRM